MSDPIYIKTQYKIQILLARANLYQALSFLFKHPGEGVIRSAINEHYPAWIAAAKGLKRYSPKSLQESLEALLKEIEKTDDREWARQYEATFGYTAHGRVPAYELEYGEEHSHRQPQQLADISAFYNAFGVQLNSNEHERVDHVSIECEFLYFLTFKEAYAWEHDGEEKAQICREAATKFMADHLGQWLPAFTSRCSRFSADNLMKRIANFAHIFIVAECDHMSVPVGRDDLPIRLIQEKDEVDCISCLTNQKNE